MNASEPYVSRGGDKLAAALERFQVNVSGACCADLGCHIGGFVDCLLRHGATKVYAVDTAYGTFAWKLRRDPRVIVLERTNAMHVTLCEPVQVVTIDVGWTRQARVLPNVAKFLDGGGDVVTLVKPHYEAPGTYLEAGVLPDDRLDEVVSTVLQEACDFGWEVMGTIPCPIRGRGGNQEYLVHLKRA